MSTRVQWRRGNTAQTATFTGAVGEITVDTDKNVVVVHDGITAGGYAAPTITFTQGAFNQANTSNTVAHAAFDAANAAGSGAYSTAAFAHANGAFNEANSAYDLAQGAYNSANNVAPQIQPSFDHANAAYGQANTATNLAQSAYNQANTAYNSASDAYNFSTGVSVTANAAFNKANSANILAQASFNTANNKVNKSGDTITGSLTVEGQANVYQRLSVGTGSYVILPNLIAQFTGTSDYYSQINQQNLSGLGSGDVVVTANNGSDTVNYIDMGIAGGDYDNTTPNAFGMVQPNDGYVMVVGNPSQDYGGNLYVGTAGSLNHADIVFIQGDDLAESARLVHEKGLVIKTGTSSTDTTSGALVVDGGVGVSGAVYAGSVYDSGARITTTISDANTAMKSYVDTANTNMKSYVDGTVSSSVSTANTNLKLYTDGIVSANLSTAEGYTDTANTKLKSYVDGQIAFVQGENDTQNTNISNLNTYAQAGYSLANATTTYSQSAYAQANTNAGAITVIQGVDNTQNTNISNLTTYAQSAYGQANTTNTYATAGYGQANTATTLAQAAYNSGNTTLTYSQAGFALANNTTTYAQAAYGQANTNAGNITVIQSVNTTQNTNITSATNTAQAAFDKANTGGTLTGATHITDITQSTTVSSGALIVDGGAGIAKNLNVGGDAIITGSLTVVGGTTSTSSSTVTYANPYLTLHDPAGNTWISSNDGVDIGIEYEYYDPVGASYVVTGGSGNGTTATLNISDNHVTPVGQIINIAGVTPSGFNGSWIVTAASLGTVSFLNTTNASVDTSGALGTAKRTTQLTISSGSWSSQDANISYGLTTTLPTGKWITVTGCTPSKYNGTYQIKTSGPGYITYDIGNPNPGAMTVFGKLTLENRHAFSGWSNDTGFFEFYKSGNFDVTGSFGGLYGGIKAGKIIASPPQSISATDLTAGGFIQVPTGTVYDSSTGSGNTLAQVASVMSLGQVTVGAANTNVTYTNSATLYIAGAPIAGNNVTMAGNTYSLEVASGKSWFGGDVEFHTANGVTFYDGTKQTTNAATYAYSTASYAKANAGTTLAQAAFDASNGVSSFANTTFATQTYATAGFDKANSATTTAQAAFNASNGVSSYANSTFATSTYATAAFNKANGAVQSAFTTITANSNIIIPSSNADSISITAALANGVSILANATSKIIDFGLQSSGVTTGTYGGSTQIPVLTVDKFGRVTYAANTSVSTTINLTGTTGSGSVAGGGTLSFSGTYGTTATVSGSTITIATPQDLRTSASPTFAGLTSTGDVSITGNLTSSKAITLTPAAYDIVLGNTSGTGSIIIGQSACTQTISIGTGAVFLGSSKTINIGTNSSLGSCTTITIGSTQGSVVTNLQGGLQLGAVTGSTGQLLGSGGSYGVAPTWTTLTGNTGISTYATSNTIYINNTGVTSLTSNNTGRITQSASNGAITFDLATSGVSSGTYSYPSLQVDSYGRITSISNQTPVTSFNGMTGAVTLSSANVTSALSYTPANKAGDNFTGNVIVPTLTANTSVTVGSGYLTTNTYISAATTANQVIDLFGTTTYRSAKYQVQMTSGSAYHTIELLMIHDGTSVWMNQYGEIFTGSSLGTFDANISGGNAQLLFTPTNAVTTVKLIRQNIVV